MKRECKAPECTRPSRALGYCTKHYRRFKTGRPLEDLPTYETCTVEGCASQVRSKHSPYCEVHYYRLRRNGTTDTVAKRVPNSQCKVEGCVRRAERVDGLCRGCWLRFRANGDFGYRNSGDKSHNWLSDDELNYRAIHLRVRAKKGSASNYECVACGGRAKHWAYNHNSKNERLGVHEQGFIVPFGTEIEDYQPMCVPCHKRLDLAKRREKNEEIKD